ncbi:tyrosine-type recombinase/integrase [Flavobacterium sp. TAB 87]|uniref:tyrosine-type recombinase/integrase n=1 Tax=Flavobacterium sp. TAB 87 TaxID=1729581 RepID=UPI00076BFE2F|nr:tyrosine-type recombinase/integrase [Flavobacterium sp. TAB 87]KVV15068.1 Tyrosine recombinase XerD [Flavobacterium sp. TAB 87]
MKKTIQTSAFQKLLKNYDQFVKVRNYKTGNSNMYLIPVFEFLIWLEESGITAIKNVSSKESISYFEYLIARPKHRGTGALGGKTIKFHLFTLGLFVSNLLENKEIQKGFYVPSYSNQSENSRNILSVAEIKTVYEHCQSHKERALLSVAYGCGLRRSEIEALGIRDIQLSTGMLIVRKGKNDKRREVPMSNTVVEYLKKYLVEERYQIQEGQTTISEALFLNNKAKPMTGEQLGDLLKKMIEQTHKYDLIQKEITLHCLRHSIAYHLGENNAGIEFIRTFLGHSQINTTYLYAIKNKKRKPVTNF